MATKLTRSLRRELSATCATKKGRICKPLDYGSRPVMVRIDPDETINFKVKGTRKEYSLHLIVAFQIAQVNQVIGDYQERMATYKIKKKAGYKRLRKPKKPFIPSMLLTK